MFKKIIQTYWQVCRFQNSPAGTPHNSLLSVVLVLVYILVKLSLYSIMPQIASDQSIRVFRQLIIATVSLLGYTYVVLYLRNMLNRYIRTINCLLACAIIIELMIITILMVLLNVPIEAGTTVSNNELVLQLAAFVLLFALAVWQIVINIYIYQQSLSLSQGYAFLVWLGLIATQMVLFYIGEML